LGTFATEYQETRKKWKPPIAKRRPSIFHHFSTDVAELRRHRRMVGARVTH
jgi:hypothetical protein